MYTTINTDSTFFFQQTRVLAAIPAESQGTAAPTPPPKPEIGPRRDAGDPVLHQGGHLRDCTLCK